jgi:rhodanese-related sulfurtransferase
MDAVAFFTAHLAHQTDVTDVHAALSAGDAGFVLVDTRSTAAWDAGHVPGALHRPTAALPGDLDPAVPVVVYCWGPGCNGASRAALVLARAGFRVREMIGGFEYWVREGLPADSATGTVSHPVDPLAAPITAPCGCAA